MYRDEHMYRGCLIWVDRLKGKYYTHDRQGGKLGVCDSIQAAVAMITRYLDE